MPKVSSQPSYKQPPTSPAKIPQTARLGLVGNTPTSRIRRPRKTNAGGALREKEEGMIGILYVLALECSIEKLEMRLRYFELVSKSGFSDESKSADG